MKVSAGEDWKLAWCISLAALALWSVGCGGAPKPAVCDRVETVELQLVPRAQLNPDREGYSRSVVVRVYQLQSAEGLAAIDFDELWQQQAGAPALALSAMSGPEEFTLIPGRTENKVLKRQPTATHLAVVAKFREYHPDSGWRVIAPLPTVGDPCQPPIGPRLTVELLNYSLRLR